MLEQEENVSVTKEDCRRQRCYWARIEELESADGGHIEDTREA